MGDIGDYWREHKEYKQRRKMGLSQRQWNRMNAEIAAENKAAKLAKHTIRCECGRTFLDANAHKCHKSRHGKLGHKGMTIERQVEAANPALDLEVPY